MAGSVPWDDLHVFLVLRRESTFAAAARALGVDATTVSRRLTRLESSLGTQLFQRTADALVPTAEAESIVGSVEGMERQAARIANQVSGRDARVEGVVRIAATASFARAFLFPKLAPLRAHYPLLEIEIVSASGRADLARDETDIALRFQRPGGGAPAEASAHVEIQSKRLELSASVHVYTTKEYIARAGRPKNGNAMKGHDLVLPNVDAPVVPGHAWFERARAIGRAAIRVDVASMAAAISAGFGVGATTALHAAEFSNLVHLTPPEVVDSRDLWILMPSDLVRVARVRVVWDYLVAITTESSSKPKRAGATLRAK